MKMLRKVIFSKSVSILIFASSLFLVAFFTVSRSGSGSSTPIISTASTGTDDPGKTIR